MEAFEFLQGCKSRDIITLFLLKIGVRQEMEKQDVKSTGNPK